MSDDAMNPDDILRDSQEQSNQVRPGVGQENAIAAGADATAAAGVDEDTVAENAAAEEDEANPV